MVVFNFPLIDITENIAHKAEDAQMYIDNIYRNPNPAIYLIDVSKFLFQADQNILLK